MKAVAYASGGDRFSQAIAGPAGRMAAMMTDAALTAAGPDPVDLARVITAVVFVAIGITHFVPPIVRVMAAMVPPAFHGKPFTPVVWVWVTGVAEIAGGLGLLFEPTRAAAGIALAVFLVCVFPANAYAAGRRDELGPVAVPFWPRLGMQVLLIALVLWVGLA